MANEETVEIANMHGDDQLQFHVQDQDTTLVNGGKAAHSTQIQQPKDVDVDVNSNIKKQPQQLNTFESDDDPMHVDFNEDQWIPCIPKLSLTGATVIAAILGIGVGLAISLSPPDTYIENTTETITRNISRSEVGDMTINVTEVRVINGTEYYFYEETRNTTNELPYSHLN